MLKRFMLQNDAVDKAMEACIDFDEDIKTADQIEDAAEPVAVNLVKEVTESEEMLARCISNVSDQTMHDVGLAGNYRDLYSGSIIEAAVFVDTRRRSFLC